MATTKTTTRSRTAKPRATAKADQSIAARTGRTIKRQPYTSAAIATGAVAAVAAAAAGAFFFSRRDQTLRETGDALASKVSGSFKDAREKVRDFIAGDEAKSQQEIAEEALTLKETGAKASPLDDLVGAQTKAGAIAY